MISIAESALKLLKKSEMEARMLFQEDGRTGYVFSSSIHRLGESLVMIACAPEKRFLLVVSEHETGIPGAFVGEYQRYPNGVALVGELSAENAMALRHYFPWTAPVALHNYHPTIGYDNRLRIGVAEMLSRLHQYEIRPVLVQRSIPDQKSSTDAFQNTIDDAGFAVFEADWRSGWGAGGYGLASGADLEAILSTDATMVSLNLPVRIPTDAPNWGDAEVETHFLKLEPPERDRILAEYANQEFVIENDSVKISVADARQCATMYASALDFVTSAFQQLRQKRKNDFDLEISFVQNEKPISSIHHLFIARELRRRGVELSSLALGFSSEYRQDRDTNTYIEQQIRIHAGIARTYGNYKLSIRSAISEGIFSSIIARETRGLFHLDTTESVWQIVVRIIAKHEPELYQIMCARLRENLPSPKSSQDIAPDQFPAKASTVDVDLPELANYMGERPFIRLSYEDVLQSDLHDRFFSAGSRLQKQCNMVLQDYFEKLLARIAVEA